MRLFFNECIIIQDGCQCYSIISAIKMMLYYWMISHHKQLVLSKKKQFLSLVWVFMVDNNVNNEPLILVSQTIFVDKCSCPSCILRTLLKNHLFLTNVIVFGSFKNIYLEQCSPRPILEWHNTTFLPFQHHLKISSTAWYFHGTTL